MSQILGTKRMLKHFPTYSLFQEYQRLTKLSVLSAADKKRILRILKIAETDDLLNTFISDFEYSLAQEEGFLEEDYIRYYEEQIKKVKDFIERIEE